jgi:hypothetical protein
MESYASQPGEACDVAADLYENIEAVAPCIAVIDQWSNIARSKYVLEKRNVVLLIILVFFLTVARSRPTEILYGKHLEQCTRTDHFAFLYRILSFCHRQLLLLNTKMMASVLMVSTGQSAHKEARRRA